MSRWLPGRGKQTRRQERNGPAEIEPTPRCCPFVNFSVVSQRRADDEDNQERNQPTIEFKQLRRSRAAQAIDCERQTGQIFHVAERRLPYQKRRVVHSIGRNVIKIEVEEKDDQSDLDLIQQCLDAEMIGITLAIEQQRHQEEADGRVKQK